MEHQKPATAAERAATEIRGLMGARQLNAADLARHMNVSRDTAARRIKGESDLTLNELEVIAVWLNVPVTRIVSPHAMNAYAA